MTANAVSIDIKGLEQLERRFDALPGKVRRKAVSKALRAAGKPIAAAAKANAPVDTGAYRKSIGVRVKTKIDGTARAIIGPRPRAKYKKSDGKRVKRGESGGEVSIPRRYAHLIEFGFTSGGITVSPNPVMTRAFQQNKDQALDTLRSSIAQFVEANA